MKRLALLFIPFIAAVTLAQAAQKVTLPVEKIIALNAALQSLDGFDRVVDQGKDAPARVIRGAYSFKGETLWIIASDLVETQKVVDIFQKAKLAKVTEISPDGTGPAIDKDPKLAARFSDEIRKLLELAQPVELQTLKREDFNLDKNEIPATTLAALAPIIANP